MNLWQKFKAARWSTKNDELYFARLKAKNKLAETIESRDLLIKCRDVVPSKSQAYDILTEIIVKLARRMGTEQYRLDYIEAKKAKHEGGIKTT